MADISAIKLPNGTTYNLKDTTARNAANSAVPNTRTVNGKALSSNISLGAGDVGAYTKKETDTKINAAIASTYKYKGSVTADKLPTSGQVVGDVYNITNDSSYGKAGMNVAWTGTTWDALGSNVDLSNYVTTSDSRLSNARPASDVYAWAKAAKKPSYSASEIGAAPASHTHTKDQVGLSNVDNTADKDKSVKSADTADSIKTYADRPTSANKVFGDGKLRYFLATGSMTEGKPTHGDSMVLDLAWDNTGNGGWDEQLAVTGQGGLQIRTMRSGTWQPWVTVYDENHKPTPSDIGAQPSGYYTTASVIGTNTPDCTVDDIFELRKGTTGGVGSVNIKQKSSGLGSEIPTGWYNYIYSPHRTGIGGDNDRFATVILCPMTFSGESFILRYSSGVLAECRAFVLDNQLASQSSNGLMSAADKKAIDREFFRMVPKGGTYIPANADLNTVQYLKVGNYYNSLSAETKTMKNCPGGAFMMYVLSPLSEAYDNESTRGYIYRLRIFVEYTGTIFTQLASSDTTAGSFTYGPWVKMTNSNDLGAVSNTINTHIANKSNPHGVTKAQVGLGNVDNTADKDKSVKYAASVPWNGVTGKPSSYPPSSHTHTKDQVGLGNVANIDQSKAIKSITRNGTTFTATALDGTTSTFTQQDTNTTYGVASQSSNGLMSAADKKAIDREFFRMVPKGGTVIPNGANLNSTAYLKVGNYYQSTNANTTNMTNIPIKKAFMMYVLSPLAEAYDDESTRAWVYRLRIFVDVIGNIFTQCVNSGATPGSFTYAPWVKMTNADDLGVVRTKLDNLSSALTEEVKLTIPVSGWSSNTTAVNGTDYYTYSTTSITGISNPHPTIICSSASGVLPSAEERMAFDNIYFVTVDTSSSKITFYAPTKPKSTVVLILLKAHLLHQ